MPRLSIIVPVYNAERYLKRALDSVLAQTMTDWECVCVNDGSSDASLGIICNYATNDARIKVITQENAGVSAARNAGLDIAQGEWVTFLDADDWIESNLYASVLERVRTDVDMVCHRAWWEDEDGLQIANHRDLKPTFFPTGDAALAEVRSSYGAVLHCIWDKFYRRSRLEVLGLRFNNKVRLSEDSLFTQMFLAQCGGVIAALDIRGYHYVMHEGSAIHNITFDMCKQQVLVFDELYTMWMTEHGNGLTKLLAHRAAAISFLGKEKGCSAELRAECIAFLSSDEIFNKRVLPFMIRNGTRKMRLFALMLAVSPIVLKKWILGRL